MANLFVNIISRYDASGTQAAEKGALNLAKTLKTAAAGLGVGAAIGEAVRFGRQSLELAQEQAKAEAQVAASIASTGNAAGVSLRQLKAHASALQDITNFGDEATLAAQSQLLTFTKIGGETFPRATEAVLDLATKMDGDLKGAVVQVGKALNDPISGMTALSRSGIQFTEQQKEQIKTLQESGRLLEAQGIILDELEKQFGGSAEAAREADGGFTALGNTFGDLQESLGALILDMNEATNATGLLEGGIKKLTEGAQAWQGNFDLFRETGRAIGRKIAPEIVDGVNFIAGAIGGPELQKSIKDFADNYVEALDEAEKATAETGPKLVDTETGTNDKIVELRRGLAEDLLDIQEETADSLAENAEKLADELVDAEEDSQDRISDIVQRGNKDRIKLAERFRKDLESLEKSTTKSIEKQKRDEDKRVERTEEEARKDEKRTRKKRQIDALADERLFQFELRNLAAEGEGIAIKEALERRAIEEQIASEKAEFEKEVESEKKQDKIATIRDEGRERRSQMQMDAAEREALLREQHGEELKELAAKVQEDAQIERESLAERKADLAEYYDERASDIREGEQKGIAEVAEGMAGIEDITLTGLSSLVTLAGDFGEDAGASFADGLESGFNRKQRISDLLALAGGRGGRATTGGGGSGGGVSPLVGAFGGSSEFFATGGVVGGPAGSARSIIAHAGEEIANPALGQSLSVDGETFAVREASRMKQAIERLINKNIQQFADQFAEEIG